MSEIAYVFAYLRYNIFATLVNTTWQMTLFIPFLWLLMKALRVKMPTTRYGFWLLAVLGPVLFPLLSMLTPRMHILDIVKVEDAAVYQTHPESSVVDAPLAFPTKAPGASPVTPPAEPVSPVPIEAKRDAGEGFSLPFSFLDLAIVFWFIVASLMFLRLARSYKRLLQLKADALKLDGGIVPKIVAELGGRMRMTKNVELLTSEKLACPISFGMASNTIILPKWVVNDAKKSVLQPMLAHELAHIKRCDYIVNFLQRILGAIFFFHPLFHLASRNLTKEREHICDDWVIFLTQRRKGYAACLTLLLEKAALPQNIYLGMAMMNRRHEIVRRIEMILSKQRKIQTNIRRKTIVAILFVGCLLMPLMAGIRIVQSLEEDTKTSELTIENQQVKEESIGKTTQAAKAEPDKSIEKPSEQAQKIDKVAMEFQWLAERQAEIAQQLEETLVQLAQNEKELVEKLAEMQKQLEATLKDELWKKQLEIARKQTELALIQAEKAQREASKLHELQRALENVSRKRQKQLEQTLQAMESEMQENLADIMRQHLEFQEQGSNLNSLIMSSESENSVALRAYVGSFEDIHKRGNVAEGILRLQKSADSLTSSRYGTMGGGYGTTDIVKTRHSMYMALHYAEQPSLILQLPPQVGDEWTDIAHVEGIEGHTVVESVKEKVEVPAGIFEDCLKVKTTITSVAMEDEPSDAFVQGTRTMYFAPGVGLVKLEYQHKTGHHTEIVLVDYATQQRDTGYFPLDMDNTWTYRFEDGHFAKEGLFTEVWTVMEQKKNAYTIYCALRRSPKTDDLR